MTVVIPVFNGAHILPITVPAVLRLHVDHIVYVDDGSTDGTPEALEQLLGDDPRVRVVRHEVNRGRASARNTGIDSSDADVVLFLDADVEPLVGYAQAMRTCVESQGVVACIAGEIDHADAVGAYGQYLKWSHRGPQVSTGPIGWKHFLSGVAAVRADALAQAGGFDPSIQYGEDLALACRLWQMAPEGLRTAPEAHVRLHDIGGLDRALDNVMSFASGLPALLASNPSALTVAGLDRLSSTRGIDRIAMRLAGSRVFGRVARGLVEHLPRTLQPAVVRYLLGHTLIRSL